jgi:hypothetical protein
MRPRHRHADRADHRRHRGLRRRDDRGNHPRLQVRRLGRRHRHRRRGSYHHHHRRHPDHRDGHRRHHQDRGLRERAAGRPDDRPERAGRLADEGACCPAKHRGEVRHRVLVEHPDAADRLRRPAAAGRAAQRASATRRGCCRRAGSARRAWVRRGRAPAEGWEYRAWHLGPPRVRSRQEALPAPRALRPPPEPPRAAAGRARQASGPRAWVAHWPRWHRCRQRLAWPQARPVRLHHCLPPSRVCYRRTLRATGARRALRRLTTLI